MKGVLFIGPTNFNLNEEAPHLGKKFNGLTKVFSIFTIARGSPSYKNIWGANFYLTKYRPIYFLFALSVGVYLCARGKIDVIVCQGPLTEGIAGVLLALIFHKQLVIEIHGDWREGPFINKKRAFEPLLRKITPIVARISFERADKIRSVAEYFLVDLRKKYPDKKYFVFPTYSDLEPFFEERDTQYKKYIATAAVLSPIKDIETLIEAFARVYRKFSDFRLVIVGDGPSLENLKLKTKNKRLENAVIFTGRLTPSEVKDIMKDCYVFVLPSLSEGLPRVLLEAMALSKPVIATCVGGVPEIVKDGVNGFLFNPKDSSKLSEKIKVLIENFDQAKKMGENGKEFASANFSNERYIQNVINVINS